MKIPLSSRSLFALCFAILAASNIAVLSGVAYNRSGKPEALTTLTERELKLPYRLYKENSGLTLRLVWRLLDTKGADTLPSWRSPVWFGAEKLEELGFSKEEVNSDKDWSHFYRKTIAKEVFVVLENNEELFGESAKQAKRRLKHFRVAESRLFAVDAGLDPQQLRKKYNDRSRFIIMKGLVRPKLNYKGKEREVVGTITRLSTESIHVPRRFRRVFDAILHKNTSQPNKFQAPRYKVALAYGHRFEPWIVSVQATGDEPDTK